LSFGLSDLEHKILNDLVLQPLKKQGGRIFIFGSRATGKHHPFSDVDLLLEACDHLTSSELAKVKEAIEESRFPFKVDIVLAGELATSYKTRVDGEKIEI
jgi:predicted nucleotidyltransferase